MNARGDFVVAWVNVPVDGSASPARSSRGSSRPTARPRPGRSWSARSPGQSGARVALMEDGSFFVVLPAYPDLVARRYGPDGSFQGESVVARRLLRGSYSIAARPDGGFALVWMRQTGDQLALVARIIGADGQPAGPERRARPRGTARRSRRGRTVTSWRPGSASRPPGTPISSISISSRNGSTPAASRWEGGSPSRGGSTASSAVFPSRGRGRQLLRSSGRRKVSSGRREPARGSRGGSTAGASTRTAPR